MAFMKSNTYFCKLINSGLPKIIVSWFFSNDPQTFKANVQQQSRVVQVGSPWPIFEKLFIQFLLLFEALVSNSPLTTYKKKHWHQFFGSFLRKNVWRKRSCQMTFEILYLGPSFAWTGSIQLNWHFLLERIPPQNIQFTRFHNMAALDPTHCNMQYLEHSVKSFIMTMKIKFLSIQSGVFFLSNTSPIL